MISLKQIRFATMISQEFKEALQRRGTRVSEMFAEHRSSDAARPKRSEVAGMPLIGAVCEADWG